MTQPLIHTDPTIKAIIEEYKTNVSSHGPQKGEDYRRVAEHLDNAGLLTIALSHSEIRLLPEGAIHIHDFKEAKTRVDVFLGKKDSIWYLFVVE